MPHDREGALPALDPEQETLTVAITCQHCYRPVHLTYRAREQIQDSQWSCPYTDCGTVQPIDLTTSCARVIPKGSGPEGSGD